MRVLEVVAPAAAGRRAVDLWVTLPRGARRRDHRPAGLPSAITHVEVPRGGEIVVETWGDDDAPVVYLMHGWGGWRGQLGTFVAPLVAAGYRVVAPDAPSHGESGPGFLGPGRGAVMELIEALEATGRRFGPAAGVVAHSLGSTAAAEAIRSSLHVERLVLVAPNHGFEDLVEQFATVLALRPRTADHLRGALTSSTGRPLRSFDLDVVGAAGGMPPTLVAHDRADRETPYRVAEAVVAAWPGARLVSTDGLGHQRILTDPGVVAAAVAHVVGPEPTPGR